MTPNYTGIFDAVWKYIIEYISQIYINTIFSNVRFMNNIKHITCNYCAIKNNPVKEIAFIYNFFAISSNEDIYKDFENYIKHYVDCVLHRFPSNILNLGWTLLKEIYINLILRRNQSKILSLVKSLEYKLPVLNMKVNDNFPLAYLEKSVLKLFVSIQTMRKTGFVTDNISQINDLVKQINNDLDTISKSCLRIDANHSDFTYQKQCFEPPMTPKNSIIKPSQKLHIKDEFYENDDAYFDKIPIHNLKSFVIEPTTESPFNQELEIILLLRRKYWAIRRIICHSSIKQRNDYLLIQTKFDEIKKDFSTIKFSNLLKNVEICDKLHASLDLLMELLGIIDDEYNTPDNDEKTEKSQNANTNVLSESLLTQMKPTPVCVSEDIFED